MSRSAPWCLRASQVSWQSPLRTPGAPSRSIHRARRRRSQLPTTVFDHLAVPRGDEVVGIVNQLAAKFRNVVLTQDWHPAGHLSFASAHAGRAPYETIAMPYGPQVLWPDHCVQDTPGAAFHSGLHIPHAALVVRKGIDRTIDSAENDRVTPTGLAGLSH